MAFGFKAVNDDRVVQIDDAYPVLQLGEFGSGAANTDIYFSRPYRTTEPPWLFMRGGGGGFLMGVKFIGGPGSWIGFRFHACGDVRHNHGLAGRNYGVWQFMVGEWGVHYSSDKYGLRIWGPNGQLLYDAGVRFISMKYQFQQWRYRSRHSDNGWLFYHHFLTLPADASLADPDNYLLVNPMVRERFNVPGGDSTSFRKVGPFTGGEVLHVTRSMYRNFEITYIQPGIIGRASL